MGRPFSVQAQVYFVLCSVVVLAALQNVTVDDAALTGPAVPVYLPSPSDWSQGNGCSVCITNPDPTLAYDGTWHNGRLFPNTNLEPAFEFTFEGSGLYIFFILANTIPNDTTLTNITFILDGVQVSSFKHTPSTSTNFEYNQAVYANGSIPYGQHTMTVMPINDTVNSVLMLFDYLIYTTDNGSSPSPPPPSVPLSTAMITAMATPTATATTSSSSGSNIGAIAGGSVGGVAALALVIMCVKQYQRYKRRKSPLPAARMVEPYVLSPEVAPTSSQVTSLSTQQIRTGSPLAKPIPRREPTVGASLATVQPSDPTSIPVQSSFNNLSNNTTEILEQVGMLRDEVAHLRRDRDIGWSTSERLEPPPRYS